MIEKAMAGNRDSFLGNRADGAGVPELRVRDACPWRGEIHLTFTRSSSSNYPRLGDVVARRDS